MSVLSLLSYSFPFFTITHKEKKNNEKKRKIMINCTKTRQENREKKEHR